MQIVFRVGDVGEDFFNGPIDYDGDFGTLLSILFFFDTSSSDLL